MSHHEMVRGMKEALPITLGLIPVALVLGAQAAGKGMLAWQVPLMTGMNFAGGSEFTAVSLWSHPLNIGLIVAMSVLVNSRHLIMGATFALMLKKLPRYHALMAIFFMTDESWAMGLADAQKHHRQDLNMPYYWGVVMNLYFCWTVFTFLGAMLGPALGNLEHYGFDMAFVAIFLVLLKGMWRGVGAAIPWLVSLLVAGCLYHMIDGAWYVAGGAISGLMVAYLRSQK